MGPAAGQYAAATRRSFALHIADEFIHHGAEAALLRDLYLPPSWPLTRPPPEWPDQVVYWPRTAARVRSIG